MAKIRKINVSETVGINPPGNGDAVMPAGTIVVYEDTDNGVTEYLLRVHDGVTDGGVPFASAPSIEHNNDINITVDSGDSTSYTWNFGQTGNLTIPGNIRKTTDASIEVDVGGSLGNIKVWTVDELVPPGGVWRLFIDDVDYPTLGTTVQIGDTVTTSWGTPITATIVDIQQDSGEWKIHVDQDITAGFANDDTVTFSTVVTTKIWTFSQDGSLQIPGGITGNNDINITIDNDDSSTYTWNFDRTGDLTAPGDITTGLDGVGGRFIQDCANGTTSMRWINVSQGSSSTQLIRAYTGDPKLNTEVERAQIRLNWDQTEDKSGLTIRTFNQTDPNNEVDHDWLFKGDGVLQLPLGGDIVDSDGNSVLGLVDNNIWVQTFETASPATDVPQVATSVEYDSAGNIIALFSHVNPDNGSTYYSVGKYTTTGTRIWTARFDDEFYTDGWGLAVDNAGGFIYIAGQTVADGGQTNATLTKISGTTGLVEWSKVYDFGYNSTSAVVDVNAEGDPVMVGFADSGIDRYVTTTKIDQTDGSVIWSRALDGQGDDQAYGMAVGPTGEVVAIGYIDQLDESTTYSVTPLTGSGVNVLVINRSDLNGAVLSDAAEIAGTGITGTIGVNAINIYTGLTGTVQEGSGAVFEIGDNGLGAYTASGIQNNGTNYLPGHKILVLGTDLGGATPANDCIITVDSVTEGGLIFNWSVTGTAAGAEPTVHSPVTGTNYQTGSGITFDLFMNSDSTYTDQPVNITAVGSNYVDNDVIVISGALLGGTSPANDLTATIDVTGNNGSGISNFLNFSGNAQTTTYRVRTDDNGIDFGGVGTWTLSNVETDTDDRMLVVKYAADGTIAWQKAIQFDEGYACSGSDADIDSEGNIYVCGQYYTDIPGPINQLMSIVKFNSSGVKQWSRRIVGNCGAFTSSIVVGADDHLYLTATTFAGTENTVTDIHLVLAKYGFDGLVEWQRLLDFTAGYSFGSSFFGSDVGGSNLAVKQDYVAVGLGFGLEESFGPDFGSVNAAVAQIPAAGNVFTVGSWDFKSASFSGTVNSTASDIVVTNANKTDYDNIANISTTTVTLEEDSSNFLVGTLYTAPSGNASLVNGAYSVTLSNTGTVTLPAGGTITEGYVTSNPTIQLTPASPDVASQKLVIKGGALYNFTDNGISINYSNNTAIVGDTLTFYISSNTYADQTLYWWIYPEGAGIGDTEYGTVVLDGSSGSFSILIDSDDYEFTVRVSPEEDNYGPGVIGVETGLINADEPTFDVDYHLHLTTGNLAETSIILGTDNHNVRTTTDGGISMTTTRGTVLFGNTPDNPITGSSHFHIMKADADNVDLFFGDDYNYVKLPTTQGVEIGANGPLWTFGTDGSLTVPGDIKSETGINIDINLSDSTLRRWSFQEDGDLVFPGGKVSIQASTSSGSIRGSTNTPIIVSSIGSTGSSSLQWVNNAVTPTALSGVIVNGGGNEGDVLILTGTYNPSTGALDKSWTFGTDGSLTFPDTTVQTTAFVQGEQVFTVDTGAVDYAPTAVDFNLLFVTSAVGYSETDPISVTLPNGVPGQRLVIFNGYNLATLTVNPGPFGRDISSGIVAEFIYSGFDGLWMPLYGTNSPT